MRFVHPEFLWGLLLLIVPIIIHLFSFRKYKTLYFSSLQFVQQIEQQNKSTQKLKNLLVLACRLLALSLIILAFAQPYFTDNKGSKSNAFPIMCVHIDNSFSMSMKGVEGELLSEAVESARNLIRKAPINTKILLSTNDLTGVESRFATKVEALDRLDQVKYSSLTRSYDEVVAWQKEHVSKENNGIVVTNTQLFYLSDFQRNTTSFETLKADSSNQYYPIKFESQVKNNLSIDSVWFDTPINKIGSTKELFVKVTNHGDDDLENISIHFQSGELKRDLFIDIKKHSSAVTSLSFLLNKAGINVGSFSLNDVHFFSDDEFFFTFDVAEKSAILVINGQDSNPNLGSIYTLDPYYQVQEVSQNSFIKGMLDDKELVVLNGLNEISSGLNSNLLEFTSGGGTIAIFPGKKVDLNTYNNFLHSLELPTITKEVAQSTRISKVNYKDPFFKGVFEQEKEQISLPGVTKFYLTNENTSNSGLGIVQLQNGKSLLYRNIGKNASYLFTSVLADEYGTFTKDILFTTILLRIGELATNKTPLYLTFGSSTNYQINKAIDANLPIIIKGKNVEFIPPKKHVGNRTSINLGYTGGQMNLTSGIYDIVHQSKTISKIGINYDRQESKIDSWSIEEIENQLKQKGISNSKLIRVDKGASAVNLNIDKPYPYWKIFVSFAILFLLAELLILKLWKNKTGN